MYIKRKLERTILRYFDSKEIIAIVGPRQAGKTTLVRHILSSKKKCMMLTFDDKDILDLFEHNTKEFITAYVKGNDYLFIDEFQYARQGGKQLKFIYDTEHIKIFISGSSSPELTVQASKYLVGRILTFTLYPFDFEEFLTARDTSALRLYRKHTLILGKNKLSHISTTVQRILAPLYEEHLLFGGYPRVVTEQNREAKKTLLKNIASTFFIREVSDYLGLIDDHHINALIKALALQIGNLIEYNELSRISETSYQTLKKYCTLLEKTYIAIYTKPFFKNKRTEIVKNPKVYFMDIGLRNVILDDFQVPDKRVDYGALLENGLAMQLLKQGRTLRYWQDKQQHEIDFVVELSQQQVAIEVKSREKSDTKTRSFHTFSTTYPTIPTYLSAVRDTKLPISFF